jgi:plasmid rolling circle replication initiator protein Rep
MPMIPSVAPLLDNIETSGTHSEPSELLKNKDSSTDDLYIFEYEKYKKLSNINSLALMNYGVESDWIDRGIKILHCGSELVFNNNKLVSANFCRLRICPMCQRRKALKTYSDFCKVLDALHDYSFLHLVLTVPNSYAIDLRETVSFMNSCSSRLFRMKELQKAFKGIARFTEVSYNAHLQHGASFHPHFHCLIAVNKSYFTSRDYISIKHIKKWWSVIWRCRDMNLKRITDDFIKNFNLLDSDLLQVHITKADEGALPEIAKYALKPLDISLTEKHRAGVLQILYQSLHGKRLVQTYGIIKQTLKDLNIDLDNECVDLDTSCELDNSHNVVYNYNYSLSRYERRG